MFGPETADEGTVGEGHDGRVDEGAHEALLVTLGDGVAGVPEEEKGRDGDDSRPAYSRRPLAIFQVRWNQLIETQGNGAARQEACQ